MFSKSCEYGIRALTVIGKAHLDHRKIGIKEICKIAQTPESFTAKILQNLVKRNILNSQKGPAGGFYFNRELDQIKLIDIVKVIDGEGIFSQCGLGLSHCDAKNPCPLHFQYEVVRNELLDMCQSNDLLQLTTAMDAKNFQR